MCQRGVGNVHPLPIDPPIQVLSSGLWVSSNDGMVPELQMPPRPLKVLQRRCLRMERSGELGWSVDVGVMLSRWRDEGGTVVENSRAEEA
jgi:hypothetical protein